MRLLESVVGAAITISLLGGSAAGVSAQDASPVPSPGASPAPMTSPVPMASPASPGTAAAVEALPVSDYWSDWLAHRHSVRERVRWAIQNANRSGLKSSGYHKRLLGVYQDELRWLQNHQPQACYASEFEVWREAVAALHANQKERVRFVRTGNARELRRTAKRQQSAVRQLDKVLSNVADCLDTGQRSGTASGENPFVGRWSSDNDFVAKDGYRNPVRANLTIDDGGRFLLRDRRNVLVCYESGFGAVPIAFKGQGEFIADDRPEFHATGKASCHPRRARVHRFPGTFTQIFAYDAVADVLYSDQFANCWWRKRTGSPADCTAFWRGMSPESDEVSAEEGAAPEEEATAVPVGSEG